MVDFAKVNTTCLGAFGGSFTIVRAATGVSASFSGILETGIRPENLPPGDGSTYAKLWTAGLSPAPVKGDEVRTTTTVYKILDFEQDVIGGLWILLRFDRNV